MSSKPFAIAAAIVHYPSASSVFPGIPRRRRHVVAGDLEWGRKHSRPPPSFLLPSPLRHRENVRGCRKPAYYSIQHNGWRGWSWSGVRDRKGEGAHVCLSVFKVMTDGTMKGRGKRNKGKDMGMWWTW